MKKFILLTTSLLVFSCSVNEMDEQDNLTNEIESLVLSDEITSEKSNFLTSKDTDNDGINELLRNPKGFNLTLHLIIRFKSVSTYTYLTEGSFQYNL